MAIRPIAGRQFGNIDEQTVLIRLTALWALNEAGLGGLLHLFRSPFTGIFVGGGAVLLIALIGYVASKPAAAIIRALLVVLIIKGMVSPHSPLPAYLAVTFQGLVGVLLFSVIPSFRLAALSLGILALLESAVQKLLVLTLLFGMPLWASFDAFVDSVMQQFGIVEDGVTISGSTWLIGLYIGGYLCFGILIGWLAGRLPVKVKEATTRLTVPALKADADNETEMKQQGPFWKRPMLRWLLLIILVLSAIYFYLPESRTFLEPLWLIVRVLGILAVWYFLLAPILMRLLRRFLQKKASQYEAEVSAALDLLPVFRQLARSAWRETAGLSAWKRWREFSIRIVAYALMYTRKT